MYFGVYSLPVFFSGFIALILSIHAWRLRVTPGGRPFVLLALACAVYSFGYAMEISSSTLPEILFWLKVEYLGIAVIPALLIFFALSYTGREKWLTAKVRVGCFVIPVITIVLVFSLERHGLHYKSFYLNTDGPFPVLAFEPGIWYWVNAFYIGVTTLFCNAVFISRWRRALPLFRKQIIIILVGSLIPVVVYLGSRMLQNGWALDLTPFAFSLTGILFFIGLFRYNLLNVATLARSILFKQLPAGILVLDERRRIVDWNRSLENYLGVHATDLGKPVEEVLDFWSEVSNDVDQKMRYRLERDDGWYEINELPLHDGKGFLLGQMIVVDDITESKLAEKELTYQNNRWGALFKNSLDAIALFDSEHRVVDVNGVFNELFGYSLSEIKGMDLDDVLEMAKPDSPDRTQTNDVLQGKSISFEGVRYNREGQPIDVLVRGIPVFMNEEQCGGYAIYTDITARKQNEEKLTYLSMHDQLTGLYNRAYFEEEVNRLSGGRNYPVSIISADVDNLKLMNDMMGHGKGDKMLRACAGLFMQTLRSSDIVARLGGDEFAIVMPDTDAFAGEAICQRIKDGIRDYNQQAEFPLSISLGVFTAKDADIALIDVLNHADDLMYRDKLLRSAEAHEKMIETLMASLAERDYMSEGHIRKVTDLCLRVGEKMDFTAQRFTTLTLFAQMHDLGKVGIPKSLLYKVGPLTDEEWGFIRQHPEKGHRIAQSCPDITRVADFILKHHEWWNGNGYPLGLKGDEIPLECRILAVADAFDAMTSARPFNTMKSREEALAEIRACAGTQFDPKVAELFLEVV